MSESLYDDTMGENIRHDKKRLQEQELYVRHVLRNLPIKTKREVLYLEDVAASMDNSGDFIRDVLWDGMVGYKHRPAKEIRQEFKEYVDNHDSPEEALLFIYANCSTIKKP